MLKPCARGAAKYGLTATDWQTHMCGLCLGLRDTHGQLARAATNTDAILLEVLTEAQQPAPAARVTAGPCPLRGMRRAPVVTATAPGIQLAATASLLLGAAKIRDHIDDSDTRPLTRRPLGRTSDSWRAKARAAAAPLGLDIEPLIAAIESQADLERAVAAGIQPTRIGGSAPSTEIPLDSAESDRAPDDRTDETPALTDAAAETPALRDGVTKTSAPHHEGAATSALLDALTGPTQLCAAELFAHTAILAGRPENADALREAGRHFGRIAHLADAIEDLHDDRAHGRFNPLLATGATTEQAHALLRESNSLLRAALTRVALDRAATIRWLLLDPLAGVVRRLGRVAGLAHTCTARACGTHPTTTAHTVTDLVETRPGVFESGIATPATRHVPAERGSVRAAPATPEMPLNRGSGWRANDPWLPATARHSAPPPQGPGPYYPQQPGPGPQFQPPWPPGGEPYPPQPYDVPGYQPGPPPPPERPSLLGGLGIICTQYCTGYACCATHTRPCSGDRKEGWVQRCDDCDPGCGDCCDCCNCCSGCSDNCDCGGCDCDCCGCCDCSC
ncbi:DUF5685 family protein [Nocardia sp. NPDC088792]|uniref:DUF5685 family protein n=1 Tax=Nocardia sp. NPDC088792 TaxID=3364332 RepID=UPI00382FCC28